MNKLIDGLIITTFADLGPIPVQNSSSLSSIQISKLSIVGMTILSMGSSLSENQPPQRVHGPIPVPDTNDYEAFAMTFIVEAEDSKDQRIESFGRVSNIWVIFRAQDRNNLILLHDKIENILKGAVSNQFSREKDLENEEIFHSIEKLINSISPKVKIEDPTEAEEVKDAEIKDPTELEEEEERVKIEIINFFTVNNEGEIETTSATTMEQLMGYKILIIANNVLKQIYLIYSETTSNRLVFMARRSVTKLNADYYRNECIIRNVNDPLEREFLLDKAFTLIQSM